jgi:hypothetical protein
MKTRCKFYATCGWEASDVEKPTLRPPQEQLRKHMRDAHADYLAKVEGWLRNTARGGADE